MTLPGRLVGRVAPARVVLGRDGGPDADPPACEESPAEAFRSGPRVTEDRPLAPGAAPAELRPDMRGWVRLTGDVWPGPLSEVLVGLGLSLPPRVGVELLGGALSKTGVLALEPPRVVPGDADAEITGVDGRTRPGFRAGGVLPGRLFRVGAHPLAAVGACDGPGVGDFDALSARCFFATSSSRISPSEASEANSNPRTLSMRLSRPKTRSRSCAFSCLSFRTADSLTTAELVERLLWR